MAALGYDPLRMNVSIAAAFVGALAATALGPAATLAAATSPDLLVNGDFSQGDLRQSWTALYPGSSAIAGWRVVGPVDYVSSAYWQSPEGAARSVDLDGTPGPGAIEQTFATLPGVTYLVSFELAANTEGPPRMKRVRVTVGGTTRVLTVDVGGRSSAAMHYEYESFTFVAPAKTATIAFASLSAPGNWNGAVLASVAVTDAKASLSARTARVAPAKPLWLLAAR